MHFFNSILALIWYIVDKIQRNKENVSGPMQHRNCPPYLGHQLYLLRYWPPFIKYILEM